MKLVTYRDFVFNPWPGQRVDYVSAKGAYAHYVSQCDSPAWEFLKFLEDESDNFRTRVTGGAKTKTCLVWSGGHLPFDLEVVEKRRVEDWGISYTSDFKGIGWASLDERVLLEIALRRLMGHAASLTFEDEERKQKESAEMDRKVVNWWLEEQFSGKK